MVKKSKQAMATITTTVPIEIYNKIKEEHLKMSALILKGYQAEHSFPAVLSRQNELEEKVNKYRIRLEETLKELYELKEKKGEKN